MPICDYEVMLAVEIRLTGTRFLCLTKVLCIYIMRNYIFLCYDE